MQQSQTVTQAEVSQATSVSATHSTHDPHRLSVIAGAQSKAAASTRPSGKALVQLLVLGVVSTVLYVLLFEYGDLLTDAARQARLGHGLYALVPMAVAFVFSIVHGAFTGRFWDALGLKARGK